MAHGEVRCCGSSLFLKSLYGVGYTMTLVKKTGDVVVPSQPIIDLVYKHVQPKSRALQFSSPPIASNNNYSSDNGNGKNERLLSTTVEELDSSNNRSVSISTGAAAFGASDSMDATENGNYNNNNNNRMQFSSKDETTVLSDAAGEICFRVPFSASKTFPQLFNELDNENICNNYGISHYGVSVTTLEEVFLRVGQDEEIDVKEREINRRKSVKSDDGKENHPKSPYLTYVLVYVQFAFDAKTKKENEFIFNFSRVLCLCCLLCVNL